MKKILLVENDSSEREDLKRMVENHYPHLEVLTAENGEEATQSLEATPVSLVVAELHMPVMDGFELLAHMNANFPKIPVVLLGASSKAIQAEKDNHACPVECLEKPASEESLKDALERNLKTSHVSGALTGIAIGSFLQLIEIEQKSCLMEVLDETQQKKGYLHLENGELYNAAYGELRGESAALEIISWDKVIIRFLSMPNRRIKKQIHSDLKGLIMEAMRMRDEKGEEQDITDLLEDIENTTSETDEFELEAVTFEEELATEANAHQEENPPLSSSDPASSPPFEQSDGEGEDVPRSGVEAAAEVHEVENSTTGTFSQGGTSMASLKGTLQNMGQEIDGVIALQVVGMDGITVAEHNPAGIDNENFPAKFTMMMKLVQRSIGELQDLGSLKEDLVQTNSSWILMRFLTEGYWLGILVSRESTLGNVRLVANKYINEMKQALQA